jgi:predicted small secreted protein
MARIRARLMLDGPGMEGLMMIRARHPQLVRCLLLVLALVLAACNTGDNSGDGGGGPY